MLREFGQSKVQPLLLRLAKSYRVAGLVDRLAPFVTVGDCRKCPALEHCLKACVGFRNLYMEAKKS